MKFHIPEVKLEPLLNFTNGELHEAKHRVRH